MIRCLFSIVVGVLVLSFVVFQSPVQAQSNDAFNATVRAAVLNVRSGPSLRSAALERLKLGTTVTVLGRNSAGTWFEVRTSQGTVGWVAALWARLSSGSVMNVPVASVSTTTQAAAAPAGNQITATVFTLRLNLRQTPSTTATKITLLRKGAVLTILGRNSAGTWLKVQTGQATQQGWVFAHLVKLTGTTLMNVAIVS
jgi:uncharacterized protein YgiM (DUF1202 family)